MTWDAIGGFAAALATLAGINVGALRWLLERHEANLSRDVSRWEEIERALFELRAQLPLEYVRREDWIRFSNTLDAKFDAMRLETREELNQLKERV